jgi:hypothetical protein
VTSIVRDDDVCPDGASDLSDVGIVNSTPDSHVARRGQKKRVAIGPRQIMDGHSREDFVPNEHRGI